MKKLIIFLLVFISCYGAIGQAISNRSSQTITVQDSRWMAQFNMFIPRYLDTLNANGALGIDSCGAMIFTYSDNSVWLRICSPKRWSLLGTGAVINDTIYTEIPIAVKIDSLGRRIIYFLKERGLISGGIVTLDSCNKIDVNPTVVNINYKQYTTAQDTGIVIAPSDPSFGRIDRIVVDTNLNVVVIEGMPSSTPLPPPIDIFSQFELAQISIPAGSTCLAIGQRIIYDQNTIPPQWVITTSGTITQSPTNTDNPYHLTRAMYVSLYQNGSNIIFTDATKDTVTAGEILKLFFYSNGAFLNQLSGTWYNGSTAVSNTISLNQFINVNDSNRYIILAAQLSAWNFPIGTEFDRLVIGLGGDDTTGAKGFYLDWIQLQQGIINNNTQLTLTTNGTSGAATYDNQTNILNIPIYGGGGGSVTADNGLTATGSNVQMGGLFIQPTTIDMNDQDLIFNYNSQPILNLSTSSPFGKETALQARYDTLGGAYGAISLSAEPTQSQSFFSADYSGADSSTTGSINIYTNVSDAIITFTAQNSFFNSLVNLNSVAHGAITDSVLTRNPTTGEVRAINAASFGGGSTPLANFYLKDSSLSSNRTVNLNSNFLKFRQNSYNPVSIDPLNDTIALRVNHSSITGAFSQLKLGDSGFPNVDIFIADPSTPATGEFSQQAGGAFIENIDITSERRENFTITSNYILSSYTNTTTGTSATSTNSIQGADHPYVSLEALKSGGNTGSIFLTDTSAMIQSLLFRVVGSNGTYILNTANSGQLTFNQYGAGAFLGASTYGAAFDVSGNIIETGAFGSYVHTIFTPSTGNTISALNNTYNIVNPAGALLALTVNLPSGPANNDVVILKYTKAITTVTYANGTVVDGIASPIAGGFLILVYDSGSSSWY